MAANRPRRENAGHRAVAMSAIEQIKAARSGLLRRADQVQLVDQGDVYEEMTEAEYQRELEQRRRDMADFVENDGDEPMDDDDEWEMGEDGERRGVARFGMARRRGERGAIMPKNDHVASIFLGGKSVKPGQNVNHGSLNDDDQDQLEHYMQQMDDGEDDEKGESQAAKKRRLLEQAMFGQSAEVQETLNQVLMEGSGMELEDEDPDIAKLRAQTRGGMSASLSNALFAGSRGVNRLSKIVGASAAAAEAFSKPLPRLTLDDEGNIVDDGVAASAMDDDLIGDDYDDAGEGGFGIGANMPDINDPTFTHGDAAGSAVKKERKGVKALPPSVKEVSFATGEAGADWFKVSAGGVAQIKHERGNVISSHAADKMEHASPLYQVKVESSTPATDGSEPAVTSSTYDEITMFWIDACELEGNIYLFGKALLPDQRSTTSVCVRINNIERNLFVLPRAYKVLDEDDEMRTATDDQVGLIDVHTEIKQLLQEKGVTKFKSKMVKREYCFDRDLPDYDELAKVGRSSLLDSDDGVPRETQYLKVVYPFTAPPLERNLKGKTFSRIFGCRSSALELFLLKRKLMGPCWITVRNIEPAPKPHSWAKFSFITQTPKNVRVLDECPDAPLLSVMSLSFRTVLNEQTNRHEIVMASYMYHDSVSIDGPTANETDVVHCTLISKLPASQLGKKDPNTGADLGLASMPVDFEVKARQINAEASKKAAANKRTGQSTAIINTSRTKLEVVPNERALLSLLLARIHTIDPDVLVSHDLHGFGVDLLLSRMGKSNIGINWSKIGRLIKSRMPVASGKGDDSFSLVDRGVGSGRLMLDTMVCSKEFLPAQKMYTLTHLAETQLRVAHREVDNASVPVAYKSTPTLLELAKCNENDAFLQLSLMFKVVMLPLSKQLTCLCGNMWSRSLRAARAERVEYLLLHDFHRHKFLIPEKYNHRERKEREAAKEEEEKRRLGPNADKKMKALRAAKNKPQYAGGLVLEPKRGFYDKYVLLLDFNSLYPSIIQEFNICFTTVKHWTVTRPGDMASPPPPGSATGHLPKVIRRLVERRRNVKIMLKKEANTTKKQELDIRQKALKLVANSMYGCLGFVQSRFYCEPLAALITSQGREILQSSVELTNSLNANVIYGDTDSIMVYSNETDLNKALELGKRIKEAINKRHQVLEIDIDGVFKNMLLLRKKKYAALKIVDLPDGSRTAQREVKGLDLVRRDWCALSKDIGLAVLGEILSGAPREEVVERIHAHLMALRDALKNNAVPLEKFIITKGLTKNPKEYADARNMPHVKVALDLMAKGKSCKAGDFIGYVICKNENESNLASRAYDPAYVVSLQGGLELDLKWYLTNQILPPVVRLVGPIEETDAGRIAYALGLDPKAFHNFGSKEERSQQDEEDELAMAQSAQDDDEKYKSAQPLHITCIHCQHSYQFPGVFHKLDGSSLNANNNSANTNAAADADKVKEERKEGEDVTMSDSTKPTPAPNNVQGLGSGSLLPVLSGLKCPHSLTSACGGCVSNDDDRTRMLIQLLNRLSHEVRRHTQQYYASFYQCSDSSCGRRSRDISVKDNKCLAPGCKGRMEREYTANMLYTQMQYFRSLFDVERAIELIQAENARRKSDSRSNLPQLQPSLPGLHASIYKQMHGHVVSVLRQSAYYWLPPTIFDTKITTKK